MTRKLLLLLAACAEVMLCQTTVVVLPPQAPDYMAPVNQASHDLTVTLNSIRRDALEQQRIDLERERLRFDEQQATAGNAAGLPNYRDAHPNEALWRVNQDVKDAVKTCRQAHDDCDKLDGMMQILSKAVRPDWTQITMAEYVEALYAIAKNATFAQGGRDLLQAAPAATTPR